MRARRSRERVIGRPLPRNRGAGPRIFERDGTPLPPGDRIEAIGRDRAERHLEVGRTESVERPHHLVLHPRRAPCGRSDTRGERAAERGGSVAQPLQTGPTTSPRCQLLNQRPITREFVAAADRRLGAYRESARRSRRRETAGRRARCSGSQRRSARARRAAFPPPRTAAHGVPARARSSTSATPPATTSRSTSSFSAGGTTRGHDCSPRASSTRRARTAASGPGAVVTARRARRAPGRGTRRFARPPRPPRAPSTP